MAALSAGQPYARSFPIHYNRKRWQEWATDVGRLRKHTPHPIQDSSQFLPTRLIRLWTSKSVIKVPFTVIIIIFINYAELGLTICSWTLLNVEFFSGVQALLAPTFQISVSDLIFCLSLFWLYLWVISFGTRVTTRPAFRGTVPKTYVESRVPPFAGQSRKLTSNPTSRISHKVFRKFTISNFRI
jgi:hypothetical protein